MEPGYADTLYLQLLESHQKFPNDHKSAIREFRVVFEQVFRKMTEGEAQVFSNIFQRVVFVIDKYSVPRELQDELHGFRQFANKVTHEPTTIVTERMYLVSLKAVCLTIHHFSKVAVPAELLSLYENIPDLSFASRVYRKIETVPLVKCIIRDKGPIETLPDGKAHYILNCEDEGDMGIFKLVVRTDERNFFEKLHALLKPYSTINLINIRKDPMQADTYMTGPETRIVLEPDFLIDASEIADCFQRVGSNYLLYFLGKLVESDANPSAFKGKIVNDHLDSLIKTPGKASDTVFQEAVESNALQAARFGQDTMDTIKGEIRINHFNNLRAVANAINVKKVRIEPTFFSAMYGLQGRLDVLTEESADENRKDVFELKSSGKVPDYDVWRNHKMQVVCYNMLLHSTFGESRKGTSSILYSAASANPLRNVATTVLDELQVLDVRNHIVDGLFRLAGNDDSILNRINAHDFGEVPVYKKDDIGAFEGAYHLAEGLYRQYYRKLLSFCLKEHQTSKIGADQNSGREDSGFSALWQETLLEKKGKYNILCGLVFDKFDKNANTVELRLSDPKLNHNFREGDLGIIYPHNGEVPEPLKSQILKGYIRSFSNGSLTFELRNKQLDEDYFNNQGEWIIEHDLFESNTWAVVQNLLKFLQAPERLRELVLGLREPEMNALPYVNVKDLTSNQEFLLNQALRAKDYFLMQGPPGTGKTSTMMVQITRQMITRPENRVVILAFTNRAVDEISTRLKKDQISFLRLGGRNAEDEDSLHGMVAGKTAGQIRQLIEGHKVFVATASSFHSRKSDLFDIVHPNILMIDEASQLTEPMVVGLLPGFSKFILIGDQKQLPAVITQSDKSCRVEDNTLRSKGIIDMRQSLFERLYQLCEKNNWGHAIGMLDSHYRMNEQIAGLINEYYHGKLVSMKPGQQVMELDDLYDFRSEDPVERLLSKSRTIFIQSGYSATSKRHEEEAKKVVSILKTLKRKYGNDFTKDTVGVVTPWRAQIAQIRNLIDDPELLEKVTVDTIERFQGSERNIIIVSLAIYHQNQLVPLQSVDLNDTVDRKLLVTVSRAKDQIIILGYDKPLEGSRYYRDLMDKIRANGGMIPYLEGMKEFGIH